MQRDGAGGGAGRENLIPAQQLGKAPPDHPPAGHRALWVLKQPL